MKLKGHVEFQNDVSYLWQSDEHRQEKYLARILRRLEYQRTPPLVVLLARSKSP